MDLTYDIQLVLAEKLDEYKAIDEYMRKTKKLNYVQFDYDVVHGLTLFMLNPDYDFEDVERQADVILDALPAVKRIFEQPFIHLKERDVIMPVEAVRTVNNATLTHIATHSELWANVKNGEIKPEKLLTRTYEDNYGIYENLVFCNVVDQILSFVRTNVRFLKELIYTNQTIEINLLERVNHLNYFLALGKLHIGYSKNFDSYYAIALKSLNKLQFILNSVIPRLKRPVYKNNRTRPRNLKVRKTNILSMHKEYHRVYKLAKFFARRQDAAVIKQVTEKDVAALKKSYFFFCQALCVFAIGHFDFACDEHKLFEFGKSIPNFTFKDWTVGFKKLAVGCPIIEITVKKDRAYKIILIPSVETDNEQLLSAVKEGVQADEYIIVTPYEEHEESAVYIDITSIESFRRLQQIFLRGMIYADSERVECPFCNNKLVKSVEKSADGSVYECHSCGTEIYEARCASTGKPYYYTKIAGLKPPIAGDGSWLARRKAEGSMYFRNITRINDENEPICPHCGTKCK